MAEKKKTTFPMLSPKSWWIIRKRFMESIPKEVTNSYLSSVLNVSKDSARTNVMAYLKMIGLINEEGKPESLANKWRDDTQYSDVCEEIKKNVYPQDLLDAAPDPVNNRQAAERWFLNETGAGKKALNRMTSFYALLSEADLEGKKKALRPPKDKKEVTPPKKERKIKKPQEEGEAEQEPLLPSHLIPSVHIDLQIHLSPEAKLDQIDKLFESMAKHLKEFFLLKRIK